MASLKEKLSHHQNSEIDNVHCYNSMESSIEDYTIDYTSKSNNMQAFSDMKQQHQQRRFSCDSQEFEFNKLSGLDLPFEEAQDHPLVASADELFYKGQLIPTIMSPYLLSSTSSCALESTSNFSIRDQFSSCRMDDIQSANIFDIARPTAPPETRSRPSSFRSMQDYNNAGAGTAGSEFRDNIYDNAAATASEPHSPRLRLNQADIYIHGGGAAAAAGLLRPPSFCAQCNPAQGGHYRHVSCSSLYTTRVCNWDPNSSSSYSSTTDSSCCSRNSNSSSQDCHHCAETTTKESSTDKEDGKSKHRRSPSFVIQSWKLLVSAGMLKKKSSSGSSNTGMIQQKPNSDDSTVDVKTSQQSLWHENAKKIKALIKIKGPSSLAASNQNQGRKKKGWFTGAINNNNKGRFTRSSPPLQRRFSQSSLLLAGEKTSHFSRPRFTHVAPSSCPASAMASPNHSGLLSPLNVNTPSTVHELHSVIQGAIAHCKQSLSSDRPPT